MLRVLSHMFQKCTEILQYPLSWLAALLIFLLDLVSNHKLLIDMVALITTMDAVWGIAVSIKLKEFTTSELFRQTLAKLAVYGCLLIAFLTLDVFVHNNTGLEVAITSGLVGILIVFTEIWSTAASMLILLPNLPILKLMQKALTGEIARKLRCSEEDVAAILAASRENKQARGKDGRFIPGRKKRK